MGAGGLSLCPAGGEVQTGNLSIPCVCHENQNRAVQSAKPGKNNKGRFQEPTATVNV